MIVRQLNPGDKFETLGGERFKLIYTVGDSRSYVQALASRRVKVGDREFEAPGTKVNISTYRRATRGGPLAESPTFIFRRDRGGISVQDSEIH